MPALSISARAGAALLWAYLAVATLAFVALSYLAHLHAWFFFDPPVTHAVQGWRDGALDAVMRAISWPGYPPQWLLVFAIIAGLLVAARWRLEALVMALGEIGVGETGFLLKPIVDRRRPPASMVWIGDHVPSDPYTFTAGHVHTGMVMFGWVAFLLMAKAKPGPLRRALVGLCVAVLLLTGFSRVYLGDHWFSDVLGGYLLGSIWLVLEILFWKYLADPTRRALGRAGRYLRGRVTARPARRAA